MSNSLCRRRRGHSLIELMSVLAVLLLFGIATARLMVSVTQIGLSANDRKIQIASIERLANDFRVDARRADSAKLNGDAEVAFLVAGDVIRYKVDQSQGVIERDEQPKDSQNTERETYPLTGRCEPAFLQYGGLIALRLTAEGAPSPWFIEAVKP